MHLTVVIGPMFAGKSTFIINKINNLDGKYLAIKPSLDKRYGDSEIVSHDKKRIKAISIENLYNFFSKINISEYKNIFIDEAQFFSRLIDSIEFLEKFNGNIYVCGLNGDFKRKPIGEINYLISRADEVKNLKGKCFKCKNPSSFSLKICGDSSQIDIGGSEKYQPVCGSCYKHYQEKSFCQTSL